ncbi:hypothetical protein [Bacillus thuringiensis]|uniref:Uncharacterized protein n=1 Tax=Bacillus thuringiensis TaxID=1428 RepID=A0A9X6WI86_BACTU|nr:hypothetical protein [Bacillus thuringiensis]PFJ33133.1 hypothetical protein COJ15_28230 [Bacillus thuringiensis]
MQNQMIAWEMVEQNKWSAKISDTNYMFVIITPLPEGKYELKYIDAELSEYTKNEKNIVQLKYNISSDSNQELALKLMEHYDHYEWDGTLDDKEKLTELLEDGTSFDIKLLADLQEYCG